MIEYVVILCHVANDRLRHTERLHAIDIDSAAREAIERYGDSDYFVAGVIQAERMNALSGWTLGSLAAVRVAIKRRLRNPGRIGVAELRNLEDAYESLRRIESDTFGAR